MPPDKVVMEIKIEPKITTADMITLRVPNRSMSHPSTGALTALATRCSVKPKETAARPTWKSCMSGLRKTGKENTETGGPQKRPTAHANTTHQP
jgi:hypothetical protein